MYTSCHSHHQNFRLTGVLENVLMHVSNETRADSVLLQENLLHRRDQPQNVAILKTRITKPATSQSSAISKGHTCSILGLPIVMAPSRSKSTYFLTSCCGIPQHFGVNHEGRRGRSRPENVRHITRRLYKKQHQNHSSQTFDRNKC